MNDDLLKILSGDNKDIDNQKLVEYLSGRLAAGEKHDIEQLMADNAFMNDAVEGLQNIKDKKDIQLYVDQLNMKLQKMLEKKKQRRQKRRIREHPWITFTILLILVICIIGYFVIRQFLGVHA